MDIVDYEKLPAGQELDALIAKNVMGIKLGRCASAELDVVDGGFACPTCLFASTRNSREEHDIEVLHYSTDIAAAWVVVEKLKATHFINITEPDEEGVDGFMCALIEKSGRTGKYSYWYRATEKTAPLAICRTALKAMEGSAS